MINSEFGPRKEERIIQEDNDDVPTSDQEKDPSGFLNPEDVRKGQENKPEIDDVPTPDQAEDLNGHLKPEDVRKGQENKQGEQKKEDKLEIEVARAVFIDTGFVDAIKGLAISRYHALIAPNERLQKLLSGKDINKKDIEELLDEIIKAFVFYENTDREKEDADKLSYIFRKIGELKDASFKLSENSKGNFADLQPYFLKINNLCEERGLEVRKKEKEVSGYQALTRSFTSSGFIESVDALVMITRNRNTEGIDPFLNYQGLSFSLETLQEVISSNMIKNEDIAEALYGIIRALDANDSYIKSGEKKEDIDSLRRMHIKLMDIQEASFSILRNIENDPGDLGRALSKIANLCEEKDSQVQKAINTANN